LTKNGDFNWKINSELEDWINDNVGFRDEISKFRVLTEFKLFNVSANPKVHIGKDGWLFYTVSNNLKLAMNTYPLDDEKLKWIKQNQEEVFKRLQKKGITYYIIITPSKASVYSEFLGDGLPVQKSVANRLASYLNENSLVPVINLYPDLTTAKKSQVVYYKTDTHWNEEGAYIGYCSIIDRLNAENILHSSPIKIKTTPSLHEGDLARMLYDIFPRDPYADPQIIDPLAEQILQGDYYDALKKATHSKRVSVFSIYDNPTAENIRVLVYGDSFFEKSRIISYFAENFSHVDFIRSYIITDDIIKITKPDIILFEITERNLDQMSQIPDQKRSI
jgi:hypothetical protein